MDSHMRDKELVFYTGQGEREGGFFVAEVDGKPVGTVAYQKKVRLLHSPKKGYRSTLPEVKELSNNIEISWNRNLMEIGTV